MIKPFHEREEAFGMTYGLGPAGYDLRVRDRLQMEPQSFWLASTIEEFIMPPTILGTVHDKSTWARRGITVQNTVIEPGWRGVLVVELTNHSRNTIVIEAGMPICQVLFHPTDRPVERPYDGKYQDQVAGQGPIY